MVGTRNCLGCGKVYYEEEQCARNGYCQRCSLDRRDRIRDEIIEEKRRYDRDLHHGVPCPVCGGKRRVKINPHREAPFWGPEFIGAEQDDEDGHFCTACDGRGVGDISSYERDERQARIDRLKRTLDES